MKHAADIAMGIAAWAWLPAALFAFLAIGLAVESLLDPGSVRSSEAALLAAVAGLLLLVYGASLAWSYG